MLRCSLPITIVKRSRLTELQRAERQAQSHEGLLAYCREWAEKQGLKLPTYGDMQSEYFSRAMLSAGKKLAGLFDRPKFTFQMFKDAGKVDDGRGKPIEIPLNCGDGP